MEAGIEREFRPVHASRWCWKGDGEAWFNGEADDNHQRQRWRLETSHRDDVQDTRDPLQARRRVRRNHGRRSRSANNLYTGRRKQTDTVTERRCAVHSDQRAYRRQHSPAHVRGEKRRLEENIQALLMSLSTSGLANYSVDLYVATYMTLTRPVGLCWKSWVITCTCIWPINLQTKAYK